MIVISNDRTKIICDNGFYEFSTNDGPYYTDPEGSSIKFAVSMVTYSGNILELYSYNMFVSKVYAMYQPEAIKRDYELLVDKWKGKMYTLYCQLKSDKGAADIRRIFADEQTNESDR